MKAIFASAGSDIKRGIPTKPKSKTIYLFLGIHGSGKTTYIKKHPEFKNFERCSAEDNPELIELHKQPFLIDLDTKSKSAVIQKNAHKWCEEQVEIHVKNGTNNIIVDNTNLTVDSLQSYVQIAQENGYDIQFILPSFRYLYYSIGKSSVESDITACVDNWTSKFIYPREQIFDHICCLIDNQKEAFDKIKKTICDYENFTSYRGLKKTNPSVWSSFCKRLV